MLLISVFSATLRALCGEIYLGAPLGAKNLGLSTRDYPKIWA